MSTVVKMIIEFVKSNKGGDRPMLMIDSLTYRQENSLEANTIWRCMEFDMRKYIAGCHTEGENIIVKIMRSQS